jgi:hypothetical protein
VRTNFRHEFHISKQEKMFIPTRVRKHSICERILCTHQHQFSINMWAGIVGDYLLGMHVLPHRFTGNHYRDFLSYDLTKLLEDVPLTVRARMWYKHDGFLIHFSCAVRDVLNNTYHNRCTGRGGPTAWPQRSPVLNPSDFYMWVHLNPLYMQLLFTTKRHIALWMPVRLSATTLESMKEFGGP